MTTTAPLLTRNGVDVDALVKTVKAIDETPELGRFKFRSSTQWKQGAQVESTFEGHTQNGVDFKRDVPLKWGGDEPFGLLGTGIYQGPTESLLHSMAHCLTVTTAYHGAAKNIEIENMKVDASGLVDLQGFLGLNKKKRPGFKEIHLQMNIDSPNSSEEVNDLFLYAQGRSPICQTVRNAIPMEFEFIIKGDESPEYTEEDETRHGVSLKGLSDTLNAVSEDPTIAQAKFYTTTRWEGGAKVETTFEKFEIPPGNFQVPDEALVLVADEPPALLGGDAGPGPSETVLHSVGNCISVVQSYFAAAEGIRARDFKIDFEGDMDLQGFTDVNDTVMPAYNKIKVKVDARGSGKSKEELQAFYESVPCRSPICDTVRNPVHVTFGLTHNGKVISGPPVSIA